MRAPPTKMAVAMGRPFSVMKYVVTGMDLRLVGDIGNCTIITNYIQYICTSNSSISILISFTIKSGDSFTPLFSPLIIFMSNSSSN